MNEKRQADLLEQYIAMLRQDIKAEPPYGLDPDMVDFARKLAKQSYLRPENQSPIDHEIQARIWQRTIDATQVNQFEHQSEDEDDMLLSQKKSKTTTFPFATIAAVMVLVLFGVMAIVATNLNPNLESLIQGAAQDETPTPVATVEPTVQGEISTPIPVQIFCDFVTTSPDSGGARIFAEPDEPETLIMTLPLGATAQVLNTIVIDGVDWYEVWYRVEGVEVTGYVSSAVTGLTDIESCDPLDTTIPNAIDFILITPTVVSPANITTVPNLSEYVPVVTALQNILFNDLITEGMLTLVYWHPDEVPADALIGQDALDNAIGQYSTPMTLFAYMPVSPSYLSVERVDDPTLLSSDYTSFTAVFMADVVVAVQDIPQGTLIDASMVELAVISADAVPDGALLGETGLETVIGQYTTRNITEGRVLPMQFITEEIPIMPTAVPITATFTATNTPTVTPTFTVTATHTHTVTPSATFTPTSPSASVQISRIPGVGQLDAEEIVIINMSNTIFIEGWSISDSDGNVFIFTNGRRLFSNATMTLVTRSGQGTPVLAYWGLDQAVFEQGETILLRDEDGIIVDTYIVP